MTRDQIFKQKYIHIESIFQLADSRFGSCNCEEDPQFKILICKRCQWIEHMIKEYNMESLT